MQQQFNEYWIGGNTPSSKNNKIWTGRFLVVSKATKVWLKESHEQWINQRLNFIYSLTGLVKPYCIELTFIRKSKHEFDYINAAQAVFDAMKEYSWIEDDNADNIKPYFGDYRYDKENPGLIIKLLKTKPIHYEHI